MISTASRALRFWGTSAILSVGLSGCYLDRLDHLGRPPTMSPVAESRDAIDPSLPAPRRPVKPTSLGGGNWRAPYSQARAPLVTGDTPASQASLWNSGPTSLFGDRRAKTIGDILTIVIEIEDEASINNQTTRSRSETDEVGIEALYGIERLVERAIGDDTVLNPAVRTNGAQDSTGSGSVARDEEINLRIAATVVDVMPNGHLLVTGNQEVRVNFELRDLQVAGIIRPEDISRQNTITYDKMANARISYGGRGQISDLQQPRLGRQIVDVLSPF
ncbi:MAG: flagellar basal body L-ring protein FlgH [Pseudomonadota bacterium]